MSEKIIDGLKQQIATKINDLIVNDPKYNTYRKIAEKAGLSETTIQRMNEGTHNCEIDSALAFIKEFPIFKVYPISQANLLKNLKKNLNGKLNGTGNTLTKIWLECSQKDYYGASDQYTKGWSYAMRQINSNVSHSLTLSTIENVIKCFEAVTGKNITMEDLGFVK